MRKILYVIPAIEPRKDSYPRVPTLLRRWKATWTDASARASGRLGVVEEPVHVQKIHGVPTILNDAITESTLQAGTRKEEPSPESSVKCADCRCGIDLQLQSRAGGKQVKLMRDLNFVPQIPGGDASERGAGRVAAHDAANHESQPNDIDPLAWLDDAGFLNSWPLKPMAAASHIYSIRRAAQILGRDEGSLGTWLINPGPKTESCGFKSMTTESSPSRAVPGGFLSIYRPK